MKLLLYRMSNGERFSFFFFYHLCYWHSLFTQLKLFNFSLSCAEFYILLVFVSTFYFQRKKKGKRNNLNMRQNPTFVFYIKTYRYVFAFKLPHKLTSSTWTAKLSRTWGTKTSQTKIKQRNWYWLLLWTHNSLWIIFAHKSFSLYALTKFGYCFLLVLRWIGWFIFLVHPLLDLLLNQRPVVSVCMCVGQSNVAEVMWYLNPKKENIK